MYYIKAVVGIPSANSLLDTSPVGRGLRYYEHRQEASSAPFFFYLVDGRSSVRSSQSPQSRGMQWLCVPPKHLLSFIMDSRGLPLIMLHKAFPCDTQENLENGKEGLFQANRPRSSFSNSPRASLVRATTVETNTQVSSYVLCFLPGSWRHHSHSDPSLLTQPVREHKLNISWPLRSWFLSEQWEVNGTGC